MVLAIPQHELATGIQVSPPPYFSCNNTFTTRDSKNCLLEKKAPWPEGVQRPTSGSPAGEAHRGREPRCRGDEGSALWSGPPGAERVLETRSPEQR